MVKVKNILQKLRPDRTNGKLVTCEERVAAIGHSCDAIGWRPVPYTIPDCFEAFMANLDADIQAFIANVHPDCYNAGFFSRTIAAQIDNAIKQLQIQRTDHIRAIHNIRIYQYACLRDLEGYCRDLEDQLTKCKEGM